MKELVLTLITPKGIKLNTAVELVSFVQVDGVRQILVGHVDAHGEFEKGKCYYVLDGKKHFFETENGIFTVSSGEVTLLSHHIKLESETLLEETQGLSKAKGDYNEFIRTKLEIVKKSGLKS